MHILTIDFLYLFPPSSPFLLFPLDTISVCTIIGLILPTTCCFCLTNLIKLCDYCVDTQKEYILPIFSLSADTISKLRTKFAEFQKARKRGYSLITRYVADYRQYNGEPDDRKEFLEGKYSRLAPPLTHLVADEN